MENKIDLKNDHLETLEEFQAKVDKLVSKFDTSKLNDEQKKIVRRKAAEKVYQDNVNRTLLELVEEIETWPQEKQDAFWGRNKK